MPYLARREARARLPGRPLAAWLRAHAWAGHVIATGTAAHVVVSMTPTIAGAANALGLYLATAALGVLIAQWIVGMVLQRRSARRPRRLLRAHFLLMLALVACTAGHLVLNA